MSTLSIRVAGLRGMFPLPPREVSRRTPSVYQQEGPRPESGRVLESQQPTTVVVVPGSGVAFEDFASFRLWYDGEDLWQVHNDVGTQQQTLTYDGTNKRITCRVDQLTPGGTQSVGLYIFVASSVGGAQDYPFPQGYVQGQCLSTFDPNCNRLRFRFRVDATMNWDISGNLQVGTYLRAHNYAGNQSRQGEHFYWYLSGNFYANEWVYVFLNPQYQHCVADDSDPLQIDTYDPSYTGHIWPVGEDVGVNSYYVPGPLVHMFDALTHFYIDGQPYNNGQSTLNTTWTFDGGGTGVSNRAWVLETTDEATEPIFSMQGTHDVNGNHPMHAASSVTVVYNGATSKYEVSWQGLQTLSIDYRVAYKTTPMKAVGGGSAGFNSGTWDGSTIQSSAGGGTLWTSPVLSRGTMYFAIQPQTAFTVSNPNGYFTEVWYQT